MARNATKGLSPLARAAAVIVAIGADEAASVYKYLTEDEIERLSVEVAKLEKLSPSDLQEVIDDFYGLCTTQKIISEGGVLYAKDILEKLLDLNLLSLIWTELRVLCKQEHLNF